MITVETQQMVRTFYDLDGPDLAELGELVEWNLYTKDSNDRPIDVQEPLVARMWLDDPTRGLLDSRGVLKKPEVGTNVFQFVLPYEGEWKLKMTRGKKQLFANETITTQVSKELPTQTINYDFEISANPASARVNSPVELIIEVKEHGRAVDLDTSKEFKVSIFGNGKRYLPQVTRVGVGRYRTEFTGQNSGYYVATAIYDKNKVVKQKMVFHEGQVSAFNLQAKDMLCNPISIGGDKWEFGISDGPATVQHVKIIDQKNGAYTMEFILPAHGAYQARLLLDGHHIQENTTVGAQIKLDSDVRCFLDWSTEM